MMSAGAAVMTLLHRRGTEWNSMMATSRVLHLSISARPSRNREESGKKKPRQNCREYFRTSEHAQLRSSDFDAKLFRKALPDFFRQLVMDSARALLCCVQHSDWCRCRYRNT